MTDDIAVQGKHFRVLILKGKSQSVIHVLFPDLFAPLRKLQKRRKYALRALYRMIWSDDLDLPVPRHHGYVKRPLDFLQITVKLSADLPFMLCRNVYDCLNDAHLLSESPPDLPGWGILLRCPPPPSVFHESSSVIHFSLF